MYVKLKKEHSLSALKVDSGTPFREYVMFFGTKLLSVSCVNGTKRVAGITYKYRSPTKDVEEYGYLEVPFDDFTIVENVDGTYFVIPDATFNMLFEEA